MSNMATQFKFSKPGGLTRRIAFRARPSWDELSAKIGSLYEIEDNNIGVSYLDNDGDEVTLSSEDELQDYYRGLSSPGPLIRFVVQDLNALRSTDGHSSRARSITPQQTNFRNTFGGHESLPLVFEVEDEWQRLPGGLGGLFLSRDSPESPHAFVEVLESDVSVEKESSGNADDESAAGDSVQSDLTFTTPVHEDKGKGKARASMQASVEDDVSSTGSIIGNEAPSKPPVHVYDMSDTEDIGVNPIKTPPSTNGAATPAQAESTPVMSEQTLNAAMLNALDEADPPVPTLDSPSTGSASLTNDVATLLSAFSTVVATHPELSEGIRNIVTNATNGTYWAAHREAVSRAAESIQRSAMEETGRTIEQIRRGTEEEAGARVADALGRVFRAFGETVSNARAFEQPSQAHHSPPPERMHMPPPHERARFGHSLPHPPPREPWHFWPHAPPHRRATTHWAGLPHPPPLPPPPHMPPPPHIPQPPPIPRMPRGPWPRPPPVPHPANLWGGRLSPFNVGREFNEAAREASAAAADARAAAADARARAAETRARASEAAYDASVPSHIVFGTFEDVAAPTENAETNPDPAPPISSEAEAPPPLSAASASNVPSNTLWGGFTETNPWKQAPTADELRAEVERAKADYKARKEMYRKMKAERKKAQEQNAQVPSTSTPAQPANPPVPADIPPVVDNVAGSSNIPASPAPVPAPVVEPTSATREAEPTPAPDPPVMHIVSNARGPYPQLEMFSVPRHQRSNTTGHAPRRGLHESRENRSLSRITRKLSDMGFTDSAYPTLSTKVMDQLASHPSASRDVEDEIVTNLIEELLTTNPQPGSSRDIPGAWH
ncbi:hypothetical protein BV22DRAFT_1111210 [Leucogyrophana mollusca]|uniref:Uncharacterized protein n=1 Tax=Leucogyrophana mollusca TaxID=85980 RepID=A0ACB8BNY1_9AGAM|nr:hypothetical protein BV22DRAFT_1111210 [Leucogyrophana mollusca]